MRALLDSNVPVLLDLGNPIPSLIRHQNGEMLNVVLKRASGSLSAISRFLSPLMIAITERYSEAVPVLIDQGADVNYTTPDRRTALYYACFLNQPQAVAKLLEAGANLEFPDGGEVLLELFKKRSTGRLRVGMWR
jgi:ankyrin repeat protein